MRRAREREREREQEESPELTNKALPNTADQDYEQEGRAIQMRLEKKRKETREQTKRHGVEIKRASKEEKERSCAKRG